MDQDLLCEDKNTYKKLQDVMSEINQLKDVLGTFNERIIHNTGMIESLDIRTRIFVPKRTDD